MQRYPMQIGGRFRDSESQDVILNPFNQEPVGQVAVAGADHMEEAISQASAAFESFRNSPTHLRVRVLERTRQAIQIRADELAKLITRESGKPIRYARAEVARAALTFGLGAGESQRLGGEVLPINLSEASAGRLLFTRRVPCGPMAALSPFNFPLNLVAHKLSPAFAIGAPVVLKPPPQSPITAHVLGNILLEAGLPEGALSVLHCPPPVAELMVRDERMKALSFTGSDAVGFYLKSIAGKKRVLLELGGNAPCVIDAGVNLDRIMPSIIEACWANAGQVCIKAQRLLVHDSLFSDFLEQFLAETQSVVCGDPLDEHTKVGPLIEARHVERVLAWVREAEAEGALRLCGGEADGQVLKPIILTRVEPHMRVFKDEVFGPVTVVEAFSEFQGALDRCNQSRYGLQAGVFTRDLNHALAAFRSLDYGTVLINDTPMFRVDNYPYGGMKDSGMGREGVHYAIQELSEIKALVLRDLS